MADDRSGQQDAAADPVTDHTGQEVSGAQRGSQGDSESPPASKREAAYRIRAKEAESKLETLQQRVTGLHRREVERVAAEMKMANPTDLWRYDVDLDDFLDAETGELNTEAVHLILAALADSKPGLFDQGGKQQVWSPGFGQGSGHAMVKPDGDSAKWSQVLSPT